MIVEQVPGQHLLVFEALVALLALVGGAPGLGAVQVQHCGLRGPLLCTTVEVLYDGFAGTDRRLRYCLQFTLEGCCTAAAGY